MHAQTIEILKTASPVQAPGEPLGFGLFFDLSRLITARAKLDADLARDLFAEFVQEEWGGTNAARLYARFRKDLEAGLVASIPELLASGRLGDLDQWFAQHILDGWYEGIYRYDGREKRVTYARALMWEPVQGLLPVQGLSDLEYGYWAERPAGFNEQ